MYEVAFWSNPGVMVLKKSGLFYRSGVCQVEHMRLVTAGVLFGQCRNHLATKFTEWL
jgi:hypothetical protein